MLNITGNGGGQSLIESALAEKNIDSTYMGPEDPDKVIIFLPGGPGLGGQYQQDTYAELKEEYGLLFLAAGSGKHAGIKGIVEELKTALSVLPAEDNYILYGHSAGSMEILSWLATNPDQSGLEAIIFESPVYSDDFAELAKNISRDDLASPPAFDSDVKMAGTYGFGMFERLLNPLLERFTRKYMLEQLSGAVEEKNMERAVETFVAREKINPVLAFLSDFFYLREFDFSQTLSTIQIPMLCLAGTDDRNVPRTHIENFIALNPSNIRAEWFEGARHFVSYERPGEVLPIVRDFLAST